MVSEPKNNSLIFLWNIKRVSLQYVLSFLIVKDNTKQKGLLSLIVYLLPIRISFYLWIYDLEPQSLRYIRNISTSFHVIQMLISVSLFKFWRKTMILHLRINRNPVYDFNGKGNLKIGSVMVYDKPGICDLLQGLRWSVNLYIEFVSFHEYLDGTCKYAICTNQYII